MRLFGREGLWVWECVGLGVQYPHTHTRTHFPLAGDETDPGFVFPLTNNL